MVYGNSLYYLYNFFFFYKYKEIKDNKFTLTKMEDDTDTWQYSPSHADGGVTVLVSEINPILSKKNVVAAIQ